MKEYIPRFSDKEYERRHRLVREGMEKLGIDCLLIPASETLTYLTNISIVFFGVYLLFPRVGDPTLFGDVVVYRSKKDRTEKGPLASRYSGAENSIAVEDSSVIKDIRGVLPPNFVDEIAGWVKERGLEYGTIGVVGREIKTATKVGCSLVGMTGPTGLNAMFFNGLSNVLPKVTFIDGTRILIDVRVIKSAEEIESVRNATRIADLCGEAVAEEMKRPGVKEGDLYAAFWDTLYRNGGVIILYRKETSSLLNLYRSGKMDMVGTLMSVLSLANQRKQPPTKR
jgi:Xaa-Pro aminopeptidase